ncbi:MAG: TlpA family protein disulfide reductase [Phycisphaerales bacterium]|nr:MAG: TlpA family protein disulfide reductase [Phycisphaerales bacterium]
MSPTSGGQPMRHLLPTVLLAAVFAACLGAGAATDQQPTFEQTMQRMLERLDEVDKGDFPTREERRARGDAVFIETANSLDLDALTFDEIGMLLQRPRLLLHQPSGHDLRPRLRERLRPLAANNTAEGAHAALLLARLENIVASDETTPALLRAITHPGAATLWSDHRGDPLWGLCNRAVRDAPPTAALDAISALLDNVPPDFEPGNFSSIDNLYESLIGLRVDRAAALAQRLRDTMLALGRERIEALGLDEDDRWWPELRLAFLEHAPVRISLVGSTGPDIEFYWWSDEDEGVTRLADLRGHVVILSFWSSDCGFCHFNFESLAPLAERYRDKPVRIVSLAPRNGYVMLDPYGEETVTTPSIAEEAEATRQIMREHSASWPFAIAEKLEYVPHYGVRGVPRMAVLDQRGVVRTLELDARVHKEAIIELIDSLLAEQVAHP